MNASQRWIALVPAALVVLAAFPGCKTGLKGHSCRQTSCTSNCLTSKASCGNAQSISGLSQKSRQGTTVRSRRVIPPKAGSKSASPTIVPGTGPSRSEPIPVQTPMEDSPISTTAKPFELPVQEILPHPPAPAPSLPLLEQSLEQNSMPLLAPPAETGTTQNETKPLLRVAQSQGWDESSTVPAAHVPGWTAYSERENAPAFSKDQLPGPQTYSKAWSDALGLPSQADQPIQRYRRSQ